MFSDRLAEEKLSHYILQMRISGNCVIGLSLLLTVSAHAAPAGPGLITTDPAPNAVVSAPLYMIHLMFNLPVDVKSAVFDVTDKNGKHIDVGQAMPMGTDGKTLMAMPSNPLPAGTYNVRWQAKGPDGKPLQGEFSFTAQ
jgi:methionine-rich copper-binding protein CopC